MAGRVTSSFERYRALSIQQKTYSVAMNYGEPDPNTHPERYLKGVWLFNNRHFFECHEILEAQWMESIGTEKTFYQMIIHAAVTFVHWENANRKGVLSLHHTFQLKAQAVIATANAPIYMGLHVAKFRADMETLVGPYVRDANLALAPFEVMIAPQIEVNGFEPLPCSEHELLVLGRIIEEDEESGWKWLSKLFLPLRPVARGPAGLRPSENVRRQSSAYRA